MNEDRKTEIEISVMDVGAGVIYFYTLSYDSENECLYEVVDNLLIAKGHNHDECDWSTIGINNIMDYTEEVLDSEDLSIQAGAK
jgi:predicted nucleic-acid-binding protein